jgi:hypothetical protein
MEKEIFKLQGLEFTIAEPTFERQKKLIFLNKKIKKHLMNNIKEELLEMEKYGNNPKSVDYMYAKADYEFKVDQTTAEYYYNPDNLKEIFETVLQGELEKIDYNGNSNDLVQLASDLSEKFFFTSNNKPIA